MESKILLGKILQRFEDQGYAKVDGYNRFDLVKSGETFVTVLRQKGTEAKVDFKRLLIGIDFYKENNSAYDEGPTALRRAGITHITSPVFSLLHLLKKAAYK
jgi:hypothetical protein